MIRVLQVIANMNFGGMEMMLMNYYRKINRKKIQFDFLIFSKEKCFFEDEINRLGGKVYHIISRRKNFVKNRIEIKKFFRDNKYDIVEFHQGITYYFPLKMAKKYGVKNRIIHNHGINRDYLKYLKLYNEFYAKNRISNLANNYFTCSKEVSSHLFSNKVIEKNMYVIINNSIDVDKFKYSEQSRIKIRNELNIKDKELLFGHVGSFTPPKNHMFLIDIFNEILKIRENSKLLLVGAGLNKEIIENKIKCLGIENKVIIIGNRNDVDEIMSAMDVFIFPSLYEGIPLTLIEAQSSGLPIFISNTINKETKLTDNGLIISLDKQASEWAKLIISYKCNQNRYEGYDIMCNTVYNINNEVKKLESLYIGMYNNKDKNL